MQKTAPMSTVRPKRAQSGRKYKSFRLRGRASFQNDSISNVKVKITSNKVIQFRVEIVRLQKAWSYEATVRKWVVSSQVSTKRAISETWFPWAKCIVVIGFTLHRLIIVTKGRYFQIMVFIAIKGSRQDVVSHCATVTLNTADYE